MKRMIKRTAEPTHLTVPVINLPDAAFKPEAIPVLSAFALGVLLCYVFTKT